MLSLAYSILAHKSSKAFSWLCLSLRTNPFNSLRCGTCRVVVLHFLCLPIMWWMLMTNIESKRVSCESRVCAQAQQQHNIGLRFEEEREREIFAALTPLSNVTFSWITPPCTSYNFFIESEWEPSQAKIMQYLLSFSIRIIVGKEKAFFNWVSVIDQSSCYFFFLFNNLFSL